MDPLATLKLLNEDADLCLSGGADGADLQWGMNAGKIGHGVIHWSFEGHRTQAPEQEVVRLTPEQLRVADRTIKRANKRLARVFPSRSEQTNNLLRRNYYEVKDTNSVYAVSSFDRETRMWEGGTAWAIQMYLDRFLEDKEDMSKCEIYVWCRKLKKWFTWNGKDWEIMISRPFTPKGIWTGIGSRDIDVYDRIEIRRVMGTYELTPSIINSIHPLISEPKIGDIVYIPDRKEAGKGRLDRTGGWAKVRQILDGQVLTFDGMMNDDLVPWSEIRDIQGELRDKYQLLRAVSKPDFTSENNQLLYWK